MFSVISVGFSFLLLISQCYGKGSLVHLNEDNWDVMLRGEWMVEFFAPWCPACKSLQPVWSEFASWSEDLDVSVAAVDITTSPGLSGRFMITALPTIFHVKDGVFRQYRGARDRDDLISFVEEAKWSQLEPVSSWRSPSSPQMSLLSHFFRLSMVLRNVHMTLTEQHAVPVWASYLLFVAATVLVGALLGLLFVCCIDLFCGQKSGGASLDAAQAPPTATGDTTHKHRKSDDEGDKQDQDDDDEDETEDHVHQDQDPSTSAASSEVRKRRTRRAD